MIAYLNRPVNEIQRKMTYVKAKKVIILAIFYQNISNLKIKENQGLGLKSVIEKPKGLEAQYSTRKGEFQNRKWRLSARQSCELGPN